MFLEFYKENKGDSDARNEAEIRLVRNTLSEKLIGEGKLINLDSTDMESKLPIPFLPSLAYTFMYEASNDIISNIKFSDNIPVILCFGKKGKYVEGLNFNLLPNEVRAVILDVIDKSVGNYYSETAINDAMNGKIAINQSIADVLLDERKRLEFLTILEVKLGVPIKKAYRKYNIAHIKNPRLIEYSDYKYIPLLYFKDSVRGANLVELQNKVIFKDK